MLEPKWDGVGLFGDGLAPVKLGGKWGYINETGKMVILPTWDEALTFADGLAPVQKGGKWGYIGKAGKVVVELSWDDAEVFSGGAATVKNGKFGFIDATGKVISEAKWASNGKFSHGLAVVHTTGHGVDGSVAIINLKGETIFEQPRRKNSPPPILISEHGISVIDNRPYNAQGSDQIGNRRTPFMDLTASKVLFERPVERHIDHTGNFVIPPAYNRANDFQNGMAFVEPENLRTTDELADTAIIDTTGAVVVPITRPQSNRMGWFTKGPESKDAPIPAAASPRRFGLVNQAGKVVVPPSWDDAEILSPDLVAYRVDGKFGLVNAKGQTVLPPTLEKVERVELLSPDLIAFYVVGKFGLLNAKGEILLQGTPEKLDYVQYHDEQTVMVRQGSKWGLLDIKTGKITPTEQPNFNQDKLALPDAFQEKKLWGVKAKDGTVLVAAQLPT